MSNLPINWSEVPIGSFARVVGGGTPPSKDPANFAMPGQGIPWLTPADLSGYRHQTIQRGARDLTEAGFAACGATLLPKGSVLFSSRAPIGYVAIAANQISTNQGFKSFVLPEGFDPRFTYYQLKHLKPEAEAIATGTTFKELSGAAAATLQFKVAPLAEQTRIADQLDTLLARVNACNDHLDAIPGILKRFRQAAVGAAMAGKLTDEWPGALPYHAWNVGELDGLCEQNRIITYGVVKLGEETPGGTPCLRTSNVRWLKFEIDGMKKIAPDLSAQYGRTILKGGEVLVNVRGTLGGVAVAEPMMRGWNVSREVAVVPVDASRINPQFAAYWISSAESQRWLARMEKGVAYVGINIEDLRRLPIRYPSMAEQDEIVRRLGGLLSVADRLEKLLAKAVERASPLTQQVLAKAFRGDLVDQHSSDEPASVLLARLASRHSTSSAEKSPRRPRQTRTTRAPVEASSMSKSRQDEDVKGHPYLAGHLRRIGVPTTAQALFKEAELPVADFYKQLAWEIAEGHVKDNQTTLEPGHAAG